MRECQRAQQVRRRVGRQATTAPTRPACCGSVQWCSHSAAAIRIGSGSGGRGCAPGAPGSRTSRRWCAPSATLATSCANGKMVTSRDHAASLLNESAPAPACKTGLGAERLVAAARRVVDRAARARLPDEHPRRRIAAGRQRRAPARRGGRRTLRARRHRRAPRAAVATAPRARFAARRRRHRSARPLSQLLLALEHARLTAESSSDAQRGCAAGCACSAGGDFRRRGGARGGDRAQQRVVVVGRRRGRRHEVGWPASCRRRRWRRRRSLRVEPAINSGSSASRSAGRAARCASMAEIAARRRRRRRRRRPRPTRRR